VQTPASPVVEVGPRLSFSTAWSTNAGLHLPLPASCPRYTTGHKLTRLTVHRLLKRAPRQVVACNENKRGQKGGVNECWQ